VPAPAPDPGPPSAPGAGPVYLGVAGAGLVRVDGGKAKTLVENRYPFSEIVIDDRGTAYAAAIGGTWSVRGDTVTQLPEPRPNVNAEQLAVGPDGVLWTLDREGAHAWDGTAWTSVPRSTFQDSLLEDIAVDRAGQVWVVTSDLLWRFDGTSWTKVDTKFTGTKTPYFKTVAAGPAGEVYVTTINGVFASDGDTWKKVPMSRRGSIITPDKLVVGADGRLASRGAVDDLAIRAPDGELKLFTLKKIGANASEAEVMAVDGSGRTWLRTDNGVVILDADGVLVQQWTPGTVPGINGEVQALAVAGNGPTLPELTDAPRGTVIGKVLVKGKPVAGATVEMCPSPASIAMFEKTPCTGRPVVHRGVTAADGTFELKDVAVGSYGFAVKPKRTWFVTWISDDCCTSLAAGQTYDIGSLKLDKDH